MKRTIDRNDWYPVYAICDIDGNTYNQVEIPDELIERYNAVRKEHSEVQGLLEILWETQERISR